MSSDAFTAYAPLNTLKPVADDIWIVDGPEIGMRYFGFTLPFPARMTIVRLPEGDLWVHSPIAWSDDLGVATAALGSVRYLVAPNTLTTGICRTGRPASPRPAAMGRRV